MEWTCVAMACTGANLPTFVAPSDALGYDQIIVDKARVRIGGDLGGDRKYHKLEQRARVAGVNMMIQLIRDRS